MRVFPYILMTLITIFVINIAFSFALPGYRTALVNIRSQIFPDMKESSQKNKTIEKDRLAESLERIDEHMASLAETKVITKTESGSIGTGSIVSSGTVVLPKEELLPKEPEIPVSGIFLAKVMPDILLKKVENKWFFGIQIFTKIGYSTYVDDRKKIKIYAFSENYDTLLVNLKLVSNMYEINETDQFFGFTFFLNPTKKDSTVRFVTSLEGRAIGIEVPKNYYSTLKKILLKK